MKTTDQRFTVKDMMIVGVMGALVFASTAFLKIGPIPTPAGPTMLKTGNILCLLAGLLFGGVRGGLAAGFGSAIYDMCDPVFIKDAPFTLIRFFLMGYLCGKIAHLGGHTGDSRTLNIIGAVVGSVFSFAFHIIKSIIELMLAGSAFSAAVASCSISAITSGINAFLAVVISLIVLPVCRSALIHAGFGGQLQPQAK